MSPWNRRWKKFERSIILLSLFLLLLSEFVAIFVPSVRILLDSGGSIFLLALALLGIFRLVDERLPDTEVILDPAEASFGEAVGRVLSKEMRIREMAIFAHTSSKYFEFVRDKKIHIDKLRLLICDPKCLISTGPLSQQTANSVSAELSLALNNWRQLSKDGFLDNLEIHKYEFCPTFHFMVVEGQRAEFGLFRPASDGIKAYRTSMNFDFSSRQVTGKRMVEDLQAFFNTIFQSFSTPVDGQDQKGKSIAGGEIAT